MPFIFRTHDCGSLAFNLSVTPSASAYCSTSRRKEFLGLLLDVCKVSIQHPGGQQVIIQYPVMLLQINSPPLPVNANGAFFFGR